MPRRIAIARAAASRFEAASTPASTPASGGRFVGGVLRPRLGNLASWRPDDGQKVQTAMTSRFPEPWWIVEIPNGFVVNDAAGQQLGVFYGRAAPNAAGHTGFVTMGEARQLAVDFARLPILLKWAA